MILAAISGGSLFTLVITIVIGGLIYFLLDWMLNKLAIPEPFNKLARVVLILAVVIFLINALLGLTGNAFIRF